MVENNDQCQNLGSIDKILQFAAIKGGFGGDNQHLMCLYPFILETFKQFSKVCRSMEEPAPCSSKSKGTALRPVPRLPVN